MPSEKHIQKGIFTGKLILSPTGDGTTMKVVEPISYTDPTGHRIRVPAEFRTDGASIPRPLWSIVGSPFSGGNYVEAAIVHDRGCMTHQYTWQRTHLIFYEAMLDSGVDENHAKLLYYGVLLGGPRWEIGSTGTVGAVGNDDGTRQLASPGVTEGQLKDSEKELKSRKAAGNPVSRKEIEKRTAPRP